MMVGNSPAVLVFILTEPPMPSPSILGARVLLTSTDSTRSAGMHVEPDLAHGGLRRRNGDAVDGDVGQARLRAAHHHVDAFAFDALQGDGRAACPERRPRWRWAAR